jgi:dTDP-4-dehydrorhamnose reductase
MLGTEVCGLLQSDHEVVPYDIDDFDITDLGSALDAVNSAAPDAVLHLAAFTQVDASEERREEAFKVNAVGTMNVVRAARLVNASFVYISTDYVFDGTKTEPYVESDEPRPINYYGYTKLQGEIYARDVTADHLIVRTSWLFGPSGGNFIDSILAKAAAGEDLRVVNDQIGCPTYAVDLAKGIKRLLEHRLKGIVHMTNTGETTWFDLARYAVEATGLKVKVKPVSSSEFRTKARRPHYSVLASTVMESCGIEPLPSWQEAVDAYLRRKHAAKGGEAS